MSTTATKPSKGRKGAAVGVPPSEIDPGPSQAAQDLSKRLADFGFEVPVALIHQWPAATFTTIARTVEQWMDEFATAATDKAIPEEDRTIVPPLLKNFEVVDEILTKFAETHARSVAEKFGDKPEAVNPYPPETMVGKIWADALLKAVGVKTADETKPADGETTAPSPETVAANPETTGAAEQPAKPAEPVAAAPAPAPAPTQVAQSNHAEAAELNARRAEESRQKRFNQQKLAIEGAQMELEEAASHQADLEDEVKALKAELKEKNAAFQNAGEQVRAAARKLQKARDGWFDPNVLPFSKGPANHPELNLPDADIGGTKSAANQDPVPAAPTPAVDAGAFIPLDNLVKGTLQEYIPGSDSELGISQKQMDAIKKVAGESIGTLEQWLKDNGGMSGDWGWKALRDKAEGIGKATMDKLVAVYLFVRGKYPIPDPDEPAPESAPAESAPAATAPEPEAADVPPSFTAEEAIERLKKLQARCESVAETCERDEGVTFLTSVGEQAGSMQANIEEHESCTPDQARAIVNWEAGVEGWADEPAEETGEDEDEESFADGLEDEDPEEADIDDEEDDGEDLDESDEDGDGE